MKKILLSLFLVLALVMSAVGGSIAETASTFDTSEYFTGKDLKGTWDKKDAQKITLTESLTIWDAGVYILSGTIADGSITVNVGDEDKVQLVLSGASITSSSSAALIVENADKVFVTLAAGTENTLTSTGFDASSEIDGAVYAKDDIVFNGEGSLTITSAKHGIVAKDDIKLTGGAYTITAQGKGILANDSVRIADGSYTIVSAEDAIKTKNDEDTSKSFVLIAGGKLNLTVGGGASNGAVHTDDMFGGSRGMSSSATANADADSAKGIKAPGQIIITGGEITMDTADDGIHSDTDVIIYGGSLTISTGDDALHADANLTVNGGNINITKSYEGLEATAITINGGNISLVSSDDGMNSAGGNDSSGWGWNDMFASDGSSITINGGTVYVNAQGDGIDANGDLIVTGGTLVVSGPTNAANGALDFNGSATITGGTVIAAGATGMAETFGTTSTQASFLVNLNGNAGSEITVKDGSGNVILSATVDKVYQCVVVSSPDLQIGETYTVSSDVTSATVTVTSVSNKNSSGGFGGGFGGGGAGRNDRDFGGSNGGRNDQNGGNDDFGGSNGGRNDQQPQETPDPSFQPGNDNFGDGFGGSSGGPGGQP